MYARELTKEYLESIGITYVSRDGKHIFRGDKELDQYDHADGYKRVNLYDRDLYKVEYALTKKRNSGEIIIGVHRLVYAWFNGEISAKLVVDHIDNNKLNNAISNLQALTPKENIWKTRVCDVYELKCMLNKPRSFYENKLEMYLDQYEQAKLMHDADRVHKLRGNISQVKARLRYWDSHNNNNEQ